MIDRISISYAPSQLCPIAVSCTPSQPVNFPVQRHQLGWNIHSLQHSNFIAGIGLEPAHAIPELLFDDHQRIFDPEHAECIDDSVSLVRSGHRSEPNSEHLPTIVNGSPHLYRESGHHGEARPQL